ncbi:hypothetical protein B0H14DRAFT_545495 [Mycena olivaceomarginata]|jgi:hypothetical protein|nr:hypothetical protein B0H14DRAFT_545495 [Mycena olivaceomarginata]
MKFRFKWSLLAISLIIATIKKTESLVQVERLSIIAPVLVLVPSSETPSAPSSLCFSSLCVSCLKISTKEEDKKSGIRLDGAPPDAYVTARQLGDSAILQNIVK